MTDGADRRDWRERVRDLLDGLSEEQLRSVRGMVSVRLRKTHAGGRPRKERESESC